MKFSNCLAVAAIILISGGVSVHANVTASATRTQLDGFDNWLIALHTDVGQIAAIDFKATGQSINNLDISIPPYDIIFGPDYPTGIWQSFQIDPRLDSHLLFTNHHSPEDPNHVLSVSSAEVDTENQLSAAVALLTPMADGPMAQIVVPANQWFELDMEIIVETPHGYQVIASRMENLFDTDPTDRATLISPHEDQQAYRIERASVGDFNGDVKTNLVDLNILGRHWNNKNLPPVDCLIPGADCIIPLYAYGDADADGYIGLKDLDILGQYFGKNYHQPPWGCRLGDLNCDDELNLLDFIILDNTYGQVGAPGQGADVNRSGKVDIADLYILVNAWMNPIILPVPEPASLALLSIVTLAFIKRR